MKNKEVLKSKKRENNVGLDKIKKKTKDKRIEKAGNLIRSTAEFKTQEKKKKNITSATATGQNQNPSAAKKKKIKKFKVIESEWQSSFINKNVTPVVSSEHAEDNSPKKKRKKSKKRKSEDGVGVVEDKKSEIGVKENGNSTEGNDNEGERRKKNRKKNKKGKPDEGVAVVEAKKSVVGANEWKSSPVKENGDATEGDANEGERRKRKRKKHKKKTNGEESSAASDRPQPPEKKPQEPEKKKRKQNQTEQAEVDTAPVKKSKKHSPDAAEVTQKNISGKDASAKISAPKKKRPKKNRHHKNLTRRDESQVVQRIVIVENIPIKMMHSFKPHFEERFSKYGKVHHIGSCEFDEATASKKFITTVVFHDAATAKKALEEDNMPYEGHRLIVRKSNEAKDTTLVVRKLKEYNEKVIRSIFTPCGPIRRISCVKKPDMDFSTVFVEFWKPESMKEALRVSEDVKIGGRKLLLGIYKSTKPEPKVVIAN